MSGETTPRLLREIHHRIVERGEPIDLVEEELINAAGDLSEDKRAGLWLYAWSLQSPAHQRYEAQSFLTRLDSAEREGGA